MRARIKQAFVKYSHPRFMKAFSYHLPFGAKQAYREQIEHLSTEKLAHLIKKCGFLMQTKIYLFWSVYEPEEERASLQHCDSSRAHFHFTLCAVG